MFITNLYFFLRVIFSVVTRPINSQSKQPQKINQIITLILVIYTMGSSSYSLSPAELRIITHNIPRLAPNDVLSIIISKNPKQKAVERVKTQEITLLQQTENDFINHLLFHPKYPFLKIFSLPQKFEIPIHFVHMLWYIASTFTISLEINIVLFKISIKHFRDQLLYRPAYQTLINLLTWL